MKTNKTWLNGTKPKTTYRILKLDTLYGVKSKSLWSELFQNKTKLNHLSSSKIIYFY